MPCPKVPLNLVESCKLLKDLSAGWEIESDRLRRTYKFKDFICALNFVNRIGELAETANHHPDIYLAWGKVEVVLFTHSAKGLTSMDFNLAQQIDSIETDRGA